MMAIKLKGVATIYDSVQHDQPTLQVTYHGGSAYTYIASGEAGQSVTVEGSAGGDVWRHIITLTVEQDSISKTIRHVVPYLRVSGDARLQICRGVA